MAMQFDEDGLKNFKDFLATYNKLSESCFNNCIINFNSRSLSAEEGNCADICVTKQMNFNNKAVGVYIVEQPRMMEKRMVEAQAEADRTIERLKLQGVDTDSLSPAEIAAAAMEERARGQ